MDVLRWMVDVLLLRSVQAAARTSRHQLVAVVRSIFGRIVAMSEDHRQARLMRASGWKGTKAPQRFTGYHKQLPKAEMKALAFKLQHQAPR